MKVSNQLKQIRSGFEISQHAFLNKVAEAIAEKIKKDTGLELTPVGKEDSGGKISMTLVGQSVDPEQNGDIEERVRRTMQGLRNPTNLVDLLR